MMLKMMLSAVEILVHELEHFFLVAVDVGTEGLVVVGTQTFDDAVDHGWAEYVVLLEDGTLALKAVGRGLAAVGQLGQILEFVFVLLLVDVYVHVGLLCNLQCVAEFESVAARNCKTCNELVDVS